SLCARTSRIPPRPDRPPSSPNRLLAFGPGRSHRSHSPGGNVPPTHGPSLPPPGFLPNRPRPFGTSWLPCPASKRLPRVEFGYNGSLGRHHTHLVGDAPSLPRHAHHRRGGLRRFQPRRLVPHGLPRSPRHRCGQPAAARFRGEPAAPPRARR